MTHLPDYESLDRSYAPRIFTGNAGPWRAGEGAPADLVGWLMTMISDPGVGAYLTGEMKLTRPWKGAVSYGVNGFTVGHGGEVLVPWPMIELWVKDIATSGNPNTVTVGFWPVLRGQVPVPGVESVLYGRSRDEVDADDFVSFAVPPGATEYRVMPASAVAFTGAIYIEEHGVSPVAAGPTLWSRYLLETTYSTRPGTETGDGSWRTVPPTPGAKINVVQVGGESHFVSVFWRYRLGAIR